MKSSSWVKLLVVGLIGIWIYSAHNNDRDAQEAESAHPTCKTNWKLCKDIDDLSAHNTNLLSPQYMCRERANSLAKYGEPKWSTIYFANRNARADFKTTGVVTLTDTDAQFQNQFGAYAHVMVVCTYDLNAQEVRDLKIIQP